MEMNLEGQAVKIYSTKDGTVIDNGTPVVRNLWDYKESTILAIAEALATKLQSGNPVLSETAVWFATFKDVHKV
jgi:hypothetical protein